LGVKLGFVSIKDYTFIIINMIL